VNWLELVGWAGSALLVWSLLQTRVLRLRALNLVGCLVLIGYNGTIRVWPMVGLNAVLVVINLYHLRQLMTTRHDDRAYQVVEVRPGDAYLTHTLRAHEGEIARYNPGFRPPPAQPGRFAFLVVRRDEVVGVVLAHDAGDEVAQVDLDYVTPRFRDFTPGEFVFRRSRLFIDRGFRRVVTRPGMMSPYYDRLGFRRDGDSYILDLPRAAA
jgi:hypothetical protein